jgi:hypothetical protein
MLRQRIFLWWPLGPTYPLRCLVARHYNNKFPRLVLDSNLDRLDATWEMKRISGNQSEMAWVRLSGEAFGFPHRPFHVKLIELFDRPTKKQFAGVHQEL